MEKQASTQQEVATVVSSSQQGQSEKPFKIVTYNCKNMETALCAFDTFSKMADIFSIQEHWYFDCQLEKLNTVSEYFNGCGKAVDTGNPILPVQMPRGYGGTAVLWRKSIDHLVTALPDGCNRIQCIEVSCQVPQGRRRRYGRSGHGRTTFSAKYDNGRTIFF
ncbi:MAG: hypothetical protein AB2693_17245 [Candidatus Thiodiazotropha sp.]